MFGPLDFHSLSLSVRAITFTFLAVYPATGYRHTRAVVISRLTSLTSCCVLKFALQKGDASLREEIFWFIFDSVLHSNLSIGRQNYFSTSLSTQEMYGDLCNNCEFLSSLCLLHLLTKIQICVVFILKRSRRTYSVDIFECSQSSTVRKF